MIRGAAYPATLYEPSAIPDLSDREERERLSPAAIRTFFNIAERWTLRDEDARALLGMANGPYYALKKSRERTLDADRLLRVSYLIGIFKALNILHGRRLADAWICLPNTNRIFGGRTPLEFMVRGGLPAMATVRRLLDARRGAA